MNNDDDLVGTLAEVARVAESKDETKLIEMARRACWERSASEDINKALDLMFSARAYRAGQVLSATAVRTRQATQDTPPL
jgi:hypothetical protein